MNARPRRRGLSLLEVILAIAIFGGAAAVLGEAARFGLDNARFARDTAFGQLMCESKLAEIAAGAALPDPVEGAPLAEGSDPAQPVWLYSVELEPLDIEGLVAVRLSVFQDMPEEMRPVVCSVVRWMVDPEVEALEAEEAAAEQAAQQSSPSSPTGQTNATGQTPPPTP